MTLAIWVFILFYFIFIFVPFPTTSFFIPSDVGILVWKNCRPSLWGLWQCSEIWSKILKILFRFLDLKVKISYSDLQLYYPRSCCCSNTLRPPHSFLQLILHNSGYLYSTHSFIYTDYTMAQKKTNLAQTTWHLGLYAVTVLMAWQHPYDSYHNCTVRTWKKKDSTGLPHKQMSKYGCQQHCTAHQPTKPCGVLFSLNLSNAINVTN